MHLYLADKNPNAAVAGSFIAGTAIEGKVLSVGGKANKGSFDGLNDVKVELPVNLAKVVKLNRFSIIARFDADKPVLVYKVTLRDFTATIRTYIPISTAIPETVELSVLIPAIIRAKDIPEDSKEYVSESVEVEAVTEKPKKKRTPKKKAKGKKGSSK